MINCLSSLYILEISSLSDVGLVKIFFHSLQNNINGTRRYYSQYLRRRVNINSVTNPVIYNGDLPKKYDGAIMAQSSWE